MAIPVKKLDKLKLGESVSDGAQRGTGSLVARRTAGGTAFYYRYTRPDGSRDRLPLGAYDSAGQKGLTLKAAVKRAAALRERYMGGARDLRAVLAHEAHAEAAKAEAERIAAEAERARHGATFGALAAAYVADLIRRGKVSAPKVDAALRRHVAEAWPEVWAKPAADVATADLLPVVGELVDAGKLREAAKLRAYLRAAYAAAVGAPSDPQAHRDLRALRITTNPAAVLSSIKDANRARDRALSLAEIRAYWRRIVELPSPSGPLLRFHLLTGAQRCEQLTRATRADLNTDERTMTLWDRKGRRRKPRRHDVPLIPAAVAALEAMATPRAGPHLFTITNGTTGAAHSSVALRVREVAAAMDEAGELDADKGRFTVGDVRRTVETVLARHVSSDVRAQLQSHGLGGVQARHYDRHSYEDEKRAALDTLYRIVTKRGATVTALPLQSRAARRR